VDFVDEPLPGKKLAILGDCQECPAAILKLAMNSDVLVHEATLENAFLNKALSRGHSTPSEYTDLDRAWAND
jgi:ribonuclease Z